MDPKRKGYQRVIEAARDQKVLWARAKLLSAELGFDGPVQVLFAALSHYEAYMREQRERTG